MVLDRVAVIAAACLLSCAATATAGFRSPPPEHLQEHIAALREADTVAGDEARCAAHPDLPGNTWREGSARARCTLLREPKFSLQQIGGMLDTPDGAAGLEREFAALLDAHYGDPAQREQIHRAFSVFDESKEARAVSDRWLSLAPDSAFALEASATHHASVGWDARGEALIANVSASDKALMADAFMTAVPLHARALELDPQLSPACVALLAIGRQMSNELESRIAPVCMRIDPDSYHVAWGLIRSAQARWGGTPDGMAYAVAYAAARVDRNPILGALLGEAAGDAAMYPNGRFVAPRHVVAQLAEVAKMAPSGTLLAYAGEGFSLTGDKWQALVHVSQGLRFWPLNAEWRNRRARVLVDLGDLAWAERDLQVATAIDDSNGWLHHTKALFERAAGRGTAAMRPHLERALQDPGSRLAALSELCAGYLLEGELEEGHDCTETLVAEYPALGEHWYMREWVLTRTGGDGLAEARRMLRERGDRSDDRQAARMLELEAMPTD